MSTVNSPVCLTGTDEIYFEIAFKLAEEALSVSEVPVGCVLVYCDEVIGRGRNRVNESKNPTSHAEFVAFKEAEDWCRKTSKIFIDVMTETTLYVSLEPCIMCSSALYQLKIARIVFGACNPRFGGLMSVASNRQYRYEHSPEITGEFSVERSINLLKRFYQRENQFAPEDKRKMKSN